ncbi:MAG: hypothetical protein DRP93_03105, partial [Candidatus Neomarinimicrobiota bacterium]
MNKISVMDIVKSRGELLKQFNETNQVLNNPDKILVNAHRGLDALQSGSNLPTAQDEVKMVFFTRPQLNLRSSQLLRSNDLIPYLSDDKNSVERYVRMMLDPRLSFGDHTQAKLTSDLVDDMNPFIPIMSNALISLSGWPDTVVPTYTSKPGIKKETITLMDGGTDIFSDFDLEASFQNVVGEAILKMVNV